MTEYYCTTCGEKCTLQHDDKAEFVPPVCPWDGERCVWIAISVEVIA